MTRPRLARTVRSLPLLAAALWLAAAAADARVVRVVVDSRQLIAAGQPIGAAGPCERIVGRVFYAFDPANPHDRQIVDLALAPRNAQGEVEAWGEFVLVGRPIPRSERHHAGGRDEPRRPDDLRLQPRGAPRPSARLRRPLRRRLPARPRRDHRRRSAGSSTSRPRRASSTSIRRRRSAAPSRASSGATSPSTRRRGRSRWAMASARRARWATRSPTPTIRRTSSPFGTSPLGERRVVPRPAWRFAREEPDGTVVDDPRSIYMAEGFDAGQDLRGRLPRDGSRRGRAPAWPPSATSSRT